MAMKPRASRRLSFPPSMPVEQPAGPGEEGPGRPEGGAQAPVARVPPRQGPGPAQDGWREGNAGHRRVVIEGVYVISVASRLLSMHPQTLRKYERLGFVSPSRSDGMLRLYSEWDIARLHMIKHLVEERGMNLAGVDLALELAGGLLELKRLMATHLDQPLRARLMPALDSILGLLRYDPWDGRRA